MYRAIMRQANAKGPESLESYECVLLGVHYWETFDPRTHARARDCLEGVVEVEPHYADAWYVLSSMYRAEVGFGANPRPDPLSRAQYAAQRAIEENPNSAAAHLMMAMALHFSRDGEGALQSIEQALRLGADDAFILSASAGRLMFHGYWDRALALYQKAVELDPFPQGWYYFVPFYWHYTQSDYEGALEYSRMLTQLVPQYHGAHGLHAAVLAELGRVSEASSAMTKAISLKPDYAESVVGNQELFWWPQPDFIRRLVASLRKAGLAVPEN